MIPQPTPQSWTPPPWAKIPAVAHMIRGAGHCPRIEKPGEFNEVALRFLNA
jgi:pimeloyl-ACP methyl ester carboxylesterase